MQLISALYIAYRQQTLSLSISANTKTSCQTVLIRSDRKGSCALPCSGNRVGCGYIGEIYGQLFFRLCCVDLTYAQRCFILCCYSAKALKNKVSDMQPLTKVRLYSQSWTASTFWFIVVINNSVQSSVSLIVNDCVYT